ncbi:MAG TPA: type II toxin-antitoxin system RelE/ParE family toxin [Solirubrobacteraceae bacterium]|jgi:mRNA interferase RelE/StbE|nr:type II toxin-antitoxin system RelE/ParE family toxin [Solirubrobacteraceae bacterium]
MSGLPPANSWTVSYARRAEKDIARLDAQVRRRVFAALERLALNDPTIDERKLKGLEEWRIRVGDWRVRFTRDDHARVIYVTHVLPRGRAYDR